MNSDTPMSDAGSHSAPRETLTSRERVVRTLRHQPVDRMPIDLGSHFSTGISAFAYWKLREHLGLGTERIWIPDIVQFLAYVDEDILQRFHCDCLLLYPYWQNPTRWNPREHYAFTVPANLHPERNADGDWIVRQGKGAMRMPAGGFFFDGQWLSEWRELDEEAELALYAREAERIYKETPYATNLMYGFGAFFGGMEWLVAATLDPEGVMASNEVALERAIARMGRVIDAMGEYVQLVSINADMGFQNGPMCRPSLAERVTMPYIKRFCQFVHQHSDIKVFHHCCGSVRPLIPMLIEAGVDVLNPVQVSAANMDASDLKAEFGRDIVFWGGGADTQNVLGVGTPQQVAENVRQLVSAFKPSGGFVFNQVHNIMGNVPPENVVAMLDMAYELAFYT
jgi:uroporphyrinogen decarboxylase